MLRSCTPTASSTKQLGKFLFNANKSIQNQQRNRYDVTIDINFRINNESKLTESLKAKGANVLSEKSNEDVFYDRIPQGTVSTDLFTLGKSDTWLSKHNGEWRVKSPAKEEVSNQTHLQKYPEPENRVPHYQEFVGEKAIRRELNLQQDATKPNQKSLEDDLKVRGIVPFATIKTKQTKYAIQDKITLEVNATNFGYALGKLAALVPNAKENNLQEGIANLQRLVLELGLDSNTLAPESIVEYIYKNNKADFYKALVDAKVVREVKQ